MTEIWILRKQLTDGHVFVVELPGGHVIYTRDEDAATKLASAIADAITAHSANETGSVMGP